MDAAEGDEVLSLRAALNEKDLDLLELREQHMQLVSRSQEARSNWEAALSSKDRAISQLEEALASRQHAIHQLVSLSSHTAEQDAELQERGAKIVALDHALRDAQIANHNLRTAADSQGREIDALRSRQQARSQDDRRLEQLRLQLTAAFQQEFAVQQQESSRLEHAAATSSAEVQRARGMLAERDEQIQFLTSRHQELKQQLEELRDRVVRDRSTSLAAAAGSEHAFSSSMVSVAAAALSQPLLGQVAELRQQLLQCTEKLQARETQSRRYKDAVRALQARLAMVDRALLERTDQTAAVQGELAQLRHVTQQMTASSSRRSTHEDLALGPRRGSRDEAWGGMSEPEGLMVALLRDLRQQLQEKDVMVVKFTSEAEAAAQSRVDLAASLDAANRRADEYQRRLVHQEELALELETQHRSTELRYRSGGPEDSGQHGAIRRAEEADRLVRQLEAQASEAARQSDQARQRQQDAQQACDEFKRQAVSLEARVDDLERKLAESKRHAERNEQRADRLERSSRDIELQLVDSDRRTKQAEAHSLILERRQRELEARSCDLETTAKEGELRAQDAESRGKMAEARVLDAEKRALEGESRCISVERRCRDLEGQLQEATLRCREAERQKQEFEVLARNAEASSKQMRQERERDLGQVQRSLDLRIHTEQREVSDLRSQLERLQRAKEAAEARAVETEAAARQQEQHVTSLRSSSQDAAQLRNSLEERIRGLEDALGARDRGIEQLKSNLSIASSEYQQSVQAYVAELDVKAAALSEAEDRFTELESLMKRIVARSSVSSGLA